MKKTFLLLLAIATFSIAYAQKDSVNTDSTIYLREVEVKAAKIISRPDGMLYLPSNKQKESSTNGYSLLNKLSMPNIRIDEVMHSVSSTNGKAVQLRLNGAITTKAELLSMDPKLIRNVEFINNPSVRYGEDIGYVINIRTRRADEGYTVGTDLTNAVTDWYGDNMAYAKWNHKNSEINLDYDFGYVDRHHNRQSEYADYMLYNGSHYLISRLDSARQLKVFSNNIQLKYNLADSASYIFQATLSGDFQHTPTDWIKRKFQETGIRSYMTTTSDHEKSFSPVLDLYFYHTLGQHQSVTANVVGTSIATDEYNFNSEGNDYAYNVDGNTWSLTSEAIYENKLKPFTMSFGFNDQWKYTRNIYTGDVSSTNNMHTNNLYMFSQISQNLPLAPSEGGGMLSYNVGIGATYYQYKQGTNNLNYWMFRPKATLSYRLSNSWSINYSFEIAQHISQIAMVSDTRIRQNSLEWTVGNPNIKPTRRTTQSVNISYSTPRIYSQIYAEWRVNNNCNMASYERTEDNQFLYMQKNQPHINMLYINNYTSWTLIPEKLIATFNGCINRFFNRGDNYNHCLTTYYYGGSLQAYLGNWTLVAQADNGWKFIEGETVDHQGSNNSLECSYRFGNCSLSLTWYHPFEAHPKMSHARLINQYIHKDILMRSDDNGNSIILNFSWKLNRGRKYKDINRTMENKDTQTGIM